MTLHPLIESAWMNAVLPELILTVGGMLLILWTAFLPKLRGSTAPLALIVFGGTYQVSAITQLFDITFLLAAILATLFAREYLESEGIEGGEFYALLMWG